ncbi:MAG: acetyl-CoA C-acetyltransferase [Chloroflexi bacterium]|uniref:acetyl-CoA C-acetyltransferase n=1 Tax=Candidatus Chlorohelix allophototropha TaxID=3003348 RepID=A0A8T7M640_9CHLR|nr:acetyl-CoA C-acetyltransferase [Chloroflexota bacterium]WJW69429.1 acetyl-CoA C-acetyltransferase [Chloroflexota bacterium L227-S17]
MAKLKSDEALIAGATRLPTGKFLGALSGFTAPELGALAIRAAMKRAEIRPELVEEVIMGNVVQAGEGQAPARQAAIKGGVPDGVPALTINKVCGSGLKAVMLAANSIKAGEQDVMIAGGMESMSSAPYMLPKARNGYRMGNGELVDLVVHDGLWCAFENLHMGMSAELIADKFEISREAQDEFAYNSQRKAAQSIEAGVFKREITPVEIKTKKGVTLFEVDEPPRFDTTLESLTALKPAFKPQGGSVTAGNAPGLSDGASAMVVLSRTAAERYGIAPQARITGYASAALEPKYVFAAPPLAVNKLLEQTGLKLGDFDLVEVNEAFAAQVLANHKELHFDLSRVNVRGGAIALGHPIGSSGAKILTTLIHALQDTGGKRGLVTLCLGGGGAVALSIELI